MLLATQADVVTAKQELTGRLRDLQNAVTESGGKPGDPSTYNHDQRTRFEALNAEMEEVFRASDELRAAKTRNRAANMAHAGELLHDLGNMTLEERLTVTGSRGMLPLADQNCYMWRSSGGVDRYIPYSDDQVRTTTAYNQAFNSFISDGGEGSSLIDPDVMNAIQSDSPEVFNTLRSDISEKGGMFIGGPQWMAGLLKELDDQTTMMSRVRVISVAPGKQLGIRKRTRKMTTWVKGSELSQADLIRDRSLAFGKRMLTPGYYTGCADISRDLLRAVPNMQGILLGEFALDLDELIETLILTGSGLDGEPLGIFTQHEDGISADRHVRTIGTTDTFDFDDFVRMKYHCKETYRRRAEWFLHRTNIAKVAMLKDANGQYLWSPSRVVGEPDLILGRPVNESEWFPNGTGPGQFHTLFADLRRLYYVAMEMRMQLERLVDQEKINNIRTFIGRIKWDAQPVLDEACSMGRFSTQAEADADNA